MSVWFDPHPPSLEQTVSSRTDSTARMVTDSARMQGALLYGGLLGQSPLVGVDLQDAMLDEAQLQRVRFGGANLTGATFDGAQLHGADFTGTFDVLRVGSKILTQSMRGLTVEQLATAELDDSTVLPDDLRAALEEHHRRQRDPGATPDQDQRLARDAPDSPARPNQAPDR